MAEIKSNAEIFSIICENRKNFNVFNIEEFETSLKEGIKEFCRINDNQVPNMFLEFIFNPLCPEMEEGNKAFTRTLLLGFLSAYLKRKPSEVGKLLFPEIENQFKKRQDGSNY